MSIAAVILAAGESRRLGKPKQLLVYRGESLLNRAIRLAQEAGALSVFAVLGAHFEIVSTSIEPTGATIIRNDRWEQGIASSIQAGLSAVNANAPQSSGVLLMGCDQPRLTAEHLRLLLDAFKGNASTSIVSSTYGGVRGVPAIFPRQAFSGLLTLSGDRGARSLIADPPCRVLTIPFAGGEVDIDSPEDISNLEE
jgi:molybdenum cofactor cytidylyltransferase